MSEPAEIGDLELAALISSRICHDVISPVGAIANGLEMLAEEQDEAMREQTMALIRKSASQASAKLQFARLAFGAAGSAGAEIDLRDAELTSPVVEISAIAIMGGIEIIVPPGVRVEADGLALMGGFEDKVVEPGSTMSATAPLVRITGLALMGGVEAKVLGKGAPAD